MSRKKLFRNEFNFFASDVLAGTLIFARIFVLRLSDIMQVAKLNGLATWQAGHENIKMRQANPSYEKSRLAWCQSALKLLLGHVTPVRVLL